MMRRKQGIRTWDLTKYFGRVVGIQGLYLDIAEGETFGLLGLSGSGKTTVIQLLLGLMRPSRGRAEVLGLDTRGQSYQIRQLAGCVPGSFNFYKDLTGEQFLKLCARVRGDHRVERRKELLEHLAIDTSGKFQYYSRGEKQKLALVQALMHDPPLLILDNPTAGLDPLSQETFHHLLLEEKTRGKTIVISTDSPSEAAQVCDRVGIVQDGYLKQVQDVAELKDRLGRRIRVTFSEDVYLEDFITEDVSVLSHQGLEWVLTVRGSMGSLVKRLGSFPVADITFLEGAVEEALTELFPKKPHKLTL